MNATLQRTLEELYGPERRQGKLGLEGITELLEAIGQPHLRFRSVHVAGTNGKGSVCALIERVLRESGLRTGLFTSPHLVDFRERIRVRGRWPAERRVAERLAHLAALPSGRGRTFFEVTTALAFDDFAHRKVDVAVVEVGLGGRLDSTNVLQPMLTVITPIGMDHAEILGPNVAAIAAEKAGILKPGIPVVLDVPDRAASRVIEQCAAACAAPVRRVTRGWTHTREVKHGRERRWSELDGAPWAERLPLRPAASFLPGNVATAVEALAALRDLGLRIDTRALSRGIERARWPGRFEACPGEPRVWWDGAHNEPAVEALAARWQEHHDGPPAVLVLAVSRDKDAQAMLRALRACFGPRPLIACRSTSERALDPGTLALAAAAAGFSADTAPDVPEALRQALARAGSGKVLLTGSLFAVGEAMAVLGGAPGEQL